MIDMSERYQQENLQKERLEQLCRNTQLIPFEQYRGEKLQLKKFHWYSDSCTSW